jgi:acetyltransferase
MEVIPDYGSPLNPVDVTAQVINEADDFMKVMKVMTDLPEIDALVIVVTQITGESGRQMARDIVKMTGQTRKPITVAWTAGEALVADNIEILKEGGVQYYGSPVRAVRAMGALMNYSVFRKENIARIGAPAAEAVDSAVHEAAVSLLAAAAGTLTEHQGKELLAKYDIPTTKEKVATTEEEAAGIAESIGFPVAMKVDSPDILHKTEAGGLKLNIQNGEETAAAFREVMDNCRKYDPKAVINGVLVQEMVSGGTEVIVGVNNDPQFGPTVMFGLGGIFVEILKDVSLRIAPLTREDAAAMIKEIKGYKVLAGARGREKADVDAIADTLVKVSRIAVDLQDHVEELDINPLIVLPEGKGVRVADALVIKKN